MILAKIKPEHRRVIRHWIDFSERHREALLKGRFTPHHAAGGYTWIEGESAKERIVTTYAQDVVVRSGAADRTVILVNATGAAGVLADLAQKPSTVELFDVIGASRGKVTVEEGLVRLPIPTSGYAVVTWKGM